jgi:hypothetical protein
MSKATFWKEPLVHFILIGMLLFFIHSFTNNENIGSGSTILIDDDDVNRLITQYKQVWNEDPSQETIKKLIEDYVNSEMLYNEALAMNLDHNDEIIKRRLKQKYEFLVSDLATIQDPDVGELKAFYNKNSDQFQSEKLYSFSQYYFSFDNRQRPDIDARKFIKSKKESRPDNNLHSDASHLKRTYINVIPQKIRSEFGNDFSEEIRTLSSIGWHGPVKSGYGFHAIHLLSIQLDSLQEFDAVQHQVKEAYNKEMIDKYNKSIQEKLIENYTITYELEQWSELDL